MLNRKIITIIYIIISAIILIPGHSLSKNYINKTPTVNLTPEKEPEIIRETMCDPQKKVCIESVAQNHVITAEIYNNTYETRTVTLTLWSRNVDIETDIKNLKKITLGGKERRKILKLTPIDITKKYGYNFNFRSVRGNFDAVHNDDYVYDLPFETNKSYKLIQGYGGKFSHFNEENYYAYDFRMPVGETITASREGTVIEVVEKFDQGGRNSSLLKKSNYIYIEHDDGTIGVYSHLKYKGSIVKAGDKVQKGQNIGYSGDTGYLDMPHLHFSVIKFLKKNKAQSIPIKLLTESGILTKLEKYTEYRKP